MLLFDVISLQTFGIIIVSKNCSTICAKQPNTEQPKHIFTYLISYTHHFDNNNTYDKMIVVFRIYFFLISCSISDAFSEGFTKYQSHIDFKMLHEVNGISFFFHVYLFIISVCFDLVYDVQVFISSLARSGSGYLYIYVYCM